MSEYPIRGDRMLTGVLQTLYEAMLDQSEPAHKIAAAEALGKILIDPNFPAHWFAEQVPHGR